MKYFLTKFRSRKLCSRSSIIYFVSGFFCVLLIFYLSRFLFSASPSVFSKSVDSTQVLRSHSISASSVYVKPNLSVSNQQSVRNALLEPKRLAVNVTRSKGPGSIQYPLNIDMPELVRLIGLKHPVDMEPINDPKFNWTIVNEHRCVLRNQNNKPPELVLLIKSAVDHFTQRDTVRLTWGDEECWGGRKVVMVFLIGSADPKQPELAQKLSVEAEKYGDIVQKNFIDRYHNNTYKILMGFDWALEFCSKAPILMFVDDDFFVYPQNVIAYIEGLSQAMSERLFSGYVWPNSKPYRKGPKAKLLKWYVNWKDYPNTYYPPFVSAGSFFVSHKIAWEISVAARYTRFLPFDDVFLGIVLQKLGYTPTHLSGVFTFKAVDQLSSDVNSMLSSHFFGNAKNMLALWKRLDCAKFCSRLNQSTSTKEF